MVERILLNQKVRKPVEKVENRGTFRIVGQVYENKDSLSKVIGYGIIDVKNSKLKLCTVKQTHALLSRYQFENAKVDEGTGKIINTECSMDRLIQFDTKQNIIGNAGVTILGRVYKDGVSTGFRILNEKGEVLDVSDKTLFKVTNFGKTLPILNAKIVDRDGSKEKFLSAIKQEFKRIDIVDNEISNYYEEEKRLEELNHKKYLEKLIKIYATRLQRYGKITRYNSAQPTKKNIKDLRILKDEYLLVKHHDIVNAGTLNIHEALTLALLLDIAKGNIGVSKYTTILIVEYMRTASDMSKHFARNLDIFPDTMIALCNDLDEEDMSVFLREANKVLDGTLFKADLRTSNVESLELRKLLSRLRNYKVKSRKRFEVERQEYRTDDFDYCSVQGIEQLGYTTDKNKVGQPFKSPIYEEGHKKTLIYLLEDCCIPFDKENFVLDEINCFGDVELMRKISKCLLKYRDAKRESESEKDYFKYPWNKHPEVFKVKAEAYLFVLAVNNLKLAKLANEINDNFSTLPLEEINKEKFNLNSEDELFYQSGGKFNRFIRLKQHESWSKPSDGKGSLSAFTEGYFASMALYMTIDANAESSML